MRPAFFLAYQTDRWRVARVVGDEIDLCEVQAEELEPPEASAEKVAERLKELGHGGEPVCLGLPSNGLLVAEIDSTNLPRRSRRTAMLYRLEEQLPIEAERLTADFLPSAGGRSLGVAVETDRLREIVDRLAEAGIETASICPTSLLALEDAVKGSSGSSRYHVVVDPPFADVYRMADGRPAAWYITRTEGGGLVRSIQVDLLVRPPEDDHPAAAVVGALETDLAERLERDTGVVLDPQTGRSVVEAAARMAAAVLRGETTPWIDLRRDALAAPNRWARLAGPLRAAAALGLTLLATLSALCYVRGTLYENLARRFDDQARNIYKNLYPNQQVPVNTKSRLESELARLAGLSGSGTSVPDRPSALDALRQIVGSLPSELRCRLVEVRIDSAGVFIEGEARDHGDAEIIAKALGRSGHLVVDSPRTEHLVKGGVAFTLAGAFAGKERSEVGTVGNAR